MYRPNKGMALSEKGSRMILDRYFDHSSPEWARDGHGMFDSPMLDTPAKCAISCVKHFRNLSSCMSFPPPPPWGQKRGFPDEPDSRIMYSQSLRIHPAVKRPRGYLGIFALAHSFQPCRAQPSTEVPPAYFASLIPTTEA